MDRVDVQAGCCRCCPARDASHCDCSVAARIRGIEPSPRAAQSMASAGGWRATSPPTRAELADQPRRRGRRPGLRLLSTAETPTSPADAVVSDAHCGTAVGLRAAPAGALGRRITPGRPRTPARPGWWSIPRPGEGGRWWRDLLRAHWMTGNLAVVDALWPPRDNGWRRCRCSAYSLRTEADDRPLRPPATAGARSATAHQHALLRMGSCRERPQVAASGRGGAGAARRPVVRHSPHRLAGAVGRSDAGLSPVDVVMNVALPEFDGASSPSPFLQGERRRSDPDVPDPERVAVCGAHARLAAATPAPRRGRLAVVLSSYPTRNSRVGTVGLDTPASRSACPRPVRRRLRPWGGRAAVDGDDSSPAPRAGGYDREYLTPTLVGVRAPLRPAYARCSRRCGACGRGGAAQLGEPPGRLYAHDGGLLRRDALRQRARLHPPPRGFGEDPAASTTARPAPSHHYLASTLVCARFDPPPCAPGASTAHGVAAGQGVGSRACFPTVHRRPAAVLPVRSTTPARAPRRSGAPMRCGGHLIPPVSSADAYGPIVAVSSSWRVLPGAGARTRPLR